MSGLKVLKSIGHNTAHSYLSLMNYIDGNYIVEYIYQIAKKTNKTILKIDILNMKVDPEEYQISQIQISLLNLNKMFKRLLDSDHIKANQIVSAIITVEFDFSKTIIDEVLNLEKPSYKCTTSIEDINGKLHIANTVEWWKY